MSGEEREVTVDRLQFTQMREKNCGKVCGGRRGERGREREREDEVRKERDREGEDERGRDKKERMKWRMRLIKNTRMGEMQIVKKQNKTKTS
jgi:hypothetical protein